jgi:flagellar basal-body rod modification protein FlgD
MSVIYTSNSTQSVQTTSNSSTAKNVLGKEDFLKLLVAQMNNQDPLNPTEGTELSAQLAQFSSLEQMTNINETLNQSLDANYLLATSINNTMSATIIGKNVKAYGNEIQLISGQSNNIYFNLGDNASKVQVEILDEVGKVVHTITKENLVEGEKSVSWNGKDNDGEELPEGKYSYRITATDQNGDNVSVETYTHGTISGVRFSNGGAVLMIGDLEVQMSDVYEIINN